MFYIYIKTYLDLSAPLRFEKMNKTLFKEFTPLCEKYVDVP